MRKRLVLLGITTPAVFWITTIICALNRENYTHISGLVSELGRDGSNTQFIFTSGLFICSLLSIIFIMDLSKVCKAYKISTIPVFIMLTFSFSIAGAGIFPLPTKLHEILGMPSILLFLSPILALFLWGNIHHLWRIKIMSSISFFVMILGFLAFFPDFYNEYAGLKQRLFHAGWSIWVIYLGFSFNQLIYLSKKDPEKQTVTKLLINN
jgi:hypothetical membrane protein